MNNKNISNQLLIGEIIHWGSMITQALLTFCELKCNTPLFKKKWYLCLPNHIPQQTEHRVQIHYSGVERGKSKLL